MCKCFDTNYRSIFYFFSKISVRASDQRIPERVDDSVVVVDIIRDRNPPQFIREPYQVQINDNQALNQTIYTVSAVDQDLKVIS